jgi:hypothetical protein
MAACGLEFDTTICKNVLEHLENDREALQCFYGVALDYCRAIAQTKISQKEGA